MRAWRRSERCSGASRGRSDATGGGGQGRPTRSSRSPFKRRAPPQRETRKHLAADAFDAERSVEPTTPAPAIGGGVAATERAREMAARKRLGKTSVEASKDYSARAPRGAVARDAHSQGRRRPRGARGCASISDGGEGRERGVARDDGRPGREGSGRNPRRRRRRLGRRWRPPKARAESDASSGARYQAEGKAYRARAEADADAVRVLAEAEARAAIREAESTVAAAAAEAGVASEGTAPARRRGGEGAS